jgi:uridine kinase
MQGKIIAFSAPSGAGKTTIVHRLLAQIPELSFSISACTRDRRGRTETNGKDYYFLSVQEFQDKIRHDEFVEWEEVYEGAFYGTLKSEIELDFRTVIILCDLEGFTYEEMAKVLDIPIGTVRSRLHRARHFLKDKLEKYAKSMGYHNGDAEDELEADSENSDE